MRKLLSPSLIKSITVFVISLVISISVMSASYFYLDDIEQDKIKAQREMRKWQSKINNSVENNQIIEEFESNFLKLVNQGVVGSENRLAWFETIQQVAKKRGMPSVKYGISTQELLNEPNLKDNYQGIDVFKSVMTLEVSMAHEGDLFSLLNNLKKANGLYAVDNCLIEKNSRGAVAEELNMKAVCNLGWYTFKGSDAD